jgi:plasmid maintenance system antidote protein VapI
MKRIPDITPGDILREEFLVPLNITVYWLGLQDEFELRGTEENSGGSQE